MIKLNNKSKALALLNFAPHYRSAIYIKMNDQLDVDFYFGQKPGYSVKKVNYSILSNFQGELKTYKLGPFSWFSGQIKLVFKSYNNIILTGDPQILSNWFMMIIGRIMGKRFYLWTHGWYGNEKGVRKILKKVYFHLANQLFLYSDRAKELMENEGFSPEKLNVVYNSLDYENQLQIRKGLKKSDIYLDYFQKEQPTLIFIGRLRKQKRLDLLLKAMKILEEKQRPVNLVLVGPFAEDYCIESEIRNYCLSEKVWIYGPNYNENINAKLIFNANLCVSPGHIGLTAIHSLMYGTPVLSHGNFINQTPEVEVIQEGFNGGFFQENDPEDLAFQIQKLLASNISSENCYKIVDEKWNPNYQIRLLKEIFEK